MTYFVYLIANQKSGTLDVGVTSNLAKRPQNQDDKASLVWFESTPCVESAIQREKQMKNWTDEWKLALIQKENPEWLDLHEAIV